MTDLEYLDRAEATLQAVERACDRINDETDADVDNQRSGGLITLTFANRTQIIINLQKPLQEIWMAARAGGFHYRCEAEPSQAGRWLDTKAGTEFFSDLSRHASAQAGLPLEFKA